MAAQYDPSAVTAAMEKRMGMGPFQDTGSIDRFSALVLRPMHRPGCILLPGVVLGSAPLLLPETPFLMASTWIASLTPGERRGRPQLMPKSPRLNAGDASAPHTSRLSTGCWMHLNRFIVSVRGLVTMASPASELHGDSDTWKTMPGEGGLLATSDGCYLYEPPGTASNHAARFSTLCGSMTNFFGAPASNWP